MSIIYARVTWKMSKTRASDVAARDRHDFRSEGHSAGLKALSYFSNCSRSSGLLGRGHARVCSGDNIAGSKLPTEEASLEISMSCLLGYLPSCFLLYLSPSNSLFSALHDIFAKISLCTRIERYLHFHQVSYEDDLNIRCEITFQTQCMHSFFSKNFNVRHKI